MFKDIASHLSADTKHEAATNYAVSVSDAFGAHLAAITFAYEPVSLVTLMGGVPPADFTNSQRALAEEAAKAAIPSLARRRGGLGSPLTSGSR